MLHVSYVINMVLKFYFLHNYLLAVNLLHRIIQQFVLYYQNTNTSFPLPCLYQTFHESSVLLVPALHPNFFISTDYVSSDYLPLFSGFAFFFFFIFPQCEFQAYTELMIFLLTVFHHFLSECFFSFLSVFFLNTHILTARGTAC